MNRKPTRRKFLRYLGMGSASAILAACGSQPTVPAPAAAPGATAVPTTAPAATAVPTAARAATAVPKAAEASPLPIVKDPLSLTYWVELNSSAAATMKTMGEVACYQELEKRTGIHLDFQHPPANQTTEQFNLVVASGKYPDVIEYNWLIDAPGGPARYIKDGVILKLNGLIDQHAPNLKKVLTEHPEWKRMIATDEGDLYAFPFIRSHPLLLVYSGPAIRADWLEKLGLKVPSTIDEWHDVLVAFRDKDPNGNGKKDEIPLTPWKSGFGGANPRGAFLNNAFIGAWGIAMEWYQEGSAVRYGALQPEFKQFLKVIAQWYKEGLIDKDYITTDSKSLDAKWTNNQFGAGVMNAGSGIGKYVQLMRPKDPKWSLVGAPYPVLKAGDKPVLGQSDSPYTGFGAAITTSNKHVVETVKYLDYAYSDAGAMLFNFGIEGVTYKMVDGYPKYTDEVMKNPKGLPIAQAMWRYFRAVSNGPFVQEPRYNEQYLGMKEQQDALKLWTQPENKKQLPPITPTQEESKKFATIMADINTRYDETYNKVVTGALPLEAWDKFIADIKQIGIDEAIKLRQAALDRYNKRA